ncbi:MAG: hypothetical protein HYS05_06110 [Acidobacteria bacterium]|nr:hypothetical protein [Acidobacteriota bacterium]
MDFVASRAAEAKHGWRTRVGEFLRAMGVTVFDPWTKPDVRGLHEYGREGIDTDKIRRQWTFAPGPAGASQRARISGKFWESLHIDLRMVDTSDFVVAYCPTNLYSVGTPHEIVVCRQQRKPVLFVSPAVTFPPLERLRAHLRGNQRGMRLLKRLEKEVPIKENAGGVPSLWYMTLVGTERFFDGFGFEPYRERFKWRRIPLDAQESGRTLQRPLLPFLEALNHRLPRRWNNALKRYVRDDEWLLWELKKERQGRR